jgi:hypothetical protein
MYFSNPTHKTKAGTAKRWAVLSMWPCKNISHIPGLFIYLFKLFFNSTHKTKIGTANRWHTTKTKPRGPIRNREQQSDHFKYTLLCQVLGRLCCASLPASSRMCKTAGAKTILLSQTGMFCLLLFFCCSSEQQPCGFVVATTLHLPHRTHRSEIERETLSK